MPQQQDPAASPTRHDVYPPTPDPNPDARTIAAGARFRDSVAAALAGLPKEPTHITHTEQDDTGYTITHDDGYSTRIRVENAERPGRFVLEVTSVGDTVRVELPLGVGNVFDTVIRNVTGLDAAAAPIVGHR